MNQSDLNPLLADPSDLPRSTTLLRANGLRCLLLHLKAGEEISEHRAPGAISVHCLQGQVLFSEGEAAAELHAGMLLSIAADIRMHCWRVKRACCWSRSLNLRPKLLTSYPTVPGSLSRSRSH